MAEFRLSKNVICKQKAKLFFVLSVLSITSILEVSDHGDSLQPCVDHIPLHAARVGHVVVAGGFGLRDVLLQVVHFVVDPLD